VCGIKCISPVNENSNERSLVISESVDPKSPLLISDDEEVNSIHKHQHFSVSSVISAKTGINYLDLEPGNEF